MKKLNLLLLIFFVVQLNAQSLSVNIGKHDPKNPLPSWNDGPGKKSIVDFVTSTTKKDDKNFVSPEDRIACFDNDPKLLGRTTFLFSIGIYQYIGKPPVFSISNSDGDYQTLQ